MEPAGNKTAFDWATAQLIFPDGERTDDSGERFDAYEQDRREVQNAKEEIANDRPSAPRADPDERQAADNK